MARGARRQPIFFDDNCGANFVGLLSRLPRRFGVEVHAFALMPNHYHLMVRSLRGALGNAMRHLNGTYARYLNHRFDWDGPVFRGRYRNRVVEDRDYWRHLLAYVHFNPVRAQLATTPDDAHWTSHPYSIGSLATPRWITTDELLALHGGQRGYKTHMRNLQLGRQALPARLADEKLWVRASSLKTPKSVPPPPNPALWLEQVVAVTGTELNQLRTPRRGRQGNPARLVAAWWLRREGGIARSTVGRVLNMSRAAVDKAVFDVNKRRNQDSLVQEWTRDLVAFSESVSPY